MKNMAALFAILRAIFFIWMKTNFTFLFISVSFLLLFVVNLARIRLLTSNDNVIEQVQLGWRKGELKNNKIKPMKNSTLIYASDWWYSVIMIVAFAFIQLIYYCMQIVYNTGDNYIIHTCSEKYYDIHCIIEKNIAIL